ncbi:COP23 domain-containing protein [Limnospira fusiformis]|uniref:COP23 domain-containing protein n=1 Tax=Limnospira fusiformis TaxID=54297 RepID=UPI001448D820|nr:hypothetical protein HFV01_09295 [Limnospira fusiformis SAG 85.79]
MIKLQYFVLMLVLAVLAGFGVGAIFNPGSSTTAADPTTNPAIDEQTTFKCVDGSSGWSTVAERGNAVSKTPMITWNSEEFGDNWTPQERCHQVSERLTRAVTNHGGQLLGLDLTHGRVNQLTVICVVNSRQQTCRENNLLFTLSQKNAPTPRTTIARIIDFSQGQDVSPIDESGYPQYFTLKSWVDRHLPHSSGF